MRLVVFANACVSLFIASVMLLDAALFPSTAKLFLEAALIGGLAGGLVLLSVRGFDLGSVRRVHSFLLTASVWITASVVAALPLWLWKMSAVDAIFESMSALTTTGATVLEGLDATEPGILLLRAEMQALGGIGFVVAGMALLPALKVGGMQLFQTESSEQGDSPFSSSAQFARGTFLVYVALIVICAVLYEAGGMSGFDAVTHAMTTVSTGGFSNYDSSFGHFDSAYLQWVATLFMLLGALPFAWYLKAVTKGSFGSEQIRLMLWSLVCVVLILTAWLELHSSLDLLTALRTVAFHVVSVVTTTGYATTDYTQWGVFAATVFLALTFVGGCTGSTAGGIKAMRWILMGRSIASSLNRVAYPHGQFPVRYEGAPVNRDVLFSVSAFFSIYALSFLLLAFALSMYQLDFATSVSGAITALANVGPGVGPLIGPSGNFAALPDGAKLLLVFGMYAGRLEILTVLVILLPAFWREVV